MQTRKPILDAEGGIVMQDQSPFISKWISRLFCTISLLIFFSSGSADYYTGMTAAKRGDYLTASTEFIKAADVGDPYAQAALCIIYSGDAPGLIRDFERSFYWCQKSADKGIPEAEYILGRQFDFGLA